MKYAIALMIALLTAQLNFASGFVTSCNVMECDGAQCGCALKKEGWKELARCDDGHQWSYIIEKDGVKKICKGINALAGPSESPCVAQNVDMVAFNTIINSTNKQNEAYEAANKAGTLDVFLAERIRQSKPLHHCWEIVK